MSYPRFVVYSGNDYASVEGVYYKTDRSHGNRPVYRRADHFDRWIWWCNQVNSFILGSGERNIGSNGGFCGSPSANLIGPWKNGSLMKGYENAKLVGIDFHNEKVRATHADAPPKQITTQTLENSSSRDQSMTMIFTYKSSKTSSWSHTVKFGFSVTNKISVDAVFASASSEISVNSEYSFNKTDTTQESVEKRYELPVLVSPKTRVSGTFCLKEYVVDIPYTLTFDVGGTRCNIPGTWKGCIYGDVTYQIKESRM